MRCTHCDLVAGKSTPLRVCPMHIGCAVCVPCHKRMTAEVPAEPVYCRCGARIGAQDPGNVCSTCKWAVRS